MLLLSPSWHKLQRHPSLLWSAFSPIPTTTLLSTWWHIPHQQYALPLRAHSSPPLQRQTPQLAPPPPPHEPPGTVPALPPPAVMAWCGVGCLTVICDADDIVLNYVSCACNGPTAFLFYNRSAHHASQLPPFLCMLGSRTLVAASTVIFAFRSGSGSSAKCCASSFFALLRLTTPPVSDFSFSDSVLALYAIDKRANAMGVSIHTRSWM